MDVYSFGMLMWEIFCEQLPFDGDLKMAIEYVVNQDSRPLIKTNDETLYNESRRMSRDLDDKSDKNSQSGPIAFCLTEELANIIRKCW